MPCAAFQLQWGGHPAEFCVLSGKRQLWRRLRTAAEPHGESRRGEWGGECHLPALLVDNFRGPAAFDGVRWPTRLYQFLAIVLQINGGNI